MQKKFKIIALGGLGENGKNTYIVETENDIVIIDAGLSNYSNKQLGIDFILPDYTYLEENKEKVRAILISHGHLDQMGAIAHILNVVDAPVYGSNYTTSFLKGYIPKSKHKFLKEIKYDQVLKIGDLSVESFRLSHAIFGNLGFLIACGKDAVVYATDYNFDQMATEYARSDIKKIVMLSNKYTIKTLMTETLAIEERGSAGSSQDHMLHLKRFIDSASGRMIISMYSSNLAGMRNIIDLAAQNQKKIVIIGRDLLTYVNVAKEFGYIEHIKDLFVRIQDINKYEDNELMIVIAGLYEDPFIELEKMAKGIHNIVKLQEGDNVLIASKPYDETEAYAQKVLDLVSLAGATITEQKINTASHAHEEDVKMMINLFEPEYIVPIKGEYRKFIHLKTIATKLGYDEDKVKIIKNGDVLEFVENGAYVAKTLKLPDQLINISGKEKTNPIILKDREILSENGYILVIMTFYKGTNERIQAAELVSGGLLNLDDIPQIKEGCLKIVDREIEAAKDSRELVNKIKNKIGRYLNTKIGKVPMVLPIRIEVDKKKVKR